MSKIDTERFIVDILQQLMEGHPLKVNILLALLKQGLFYTDGSIVRIVNMKKGPSLEEAITNEPIITKEHDIDMEATVEKYKERLKSALNDRTTDYEVVRWIEQTFSELVESEDDRIRKQLIEHTKWSYDEQEISEEEKERWISWLEEQGQHKNFRDSIQVGDKVTKNEDGVLVNLSQLKRVAKKDEQILANSAKTCKDEQKPAWSEEDETMIEIIINDIVAIKERTYCKNVCDEEINWLESLKDRVQPQNRWKPDKAVIQILELIIQGKANPTNYQATLMNLVEQLKKLK